MIELSKWAWLATACWGIGLAALVSTYLWARSRDSFTASQQVISVIQALPALIIIWVIIGLAAAATSFWLRTRGA